MKPTIDDTKFGSITIEGEKIRHDVVIRLNGDVEKRKKKLSKALYGTSHVISLDEAKYVYQDGAEHLIVGTGQNGLVTLSAEATEYLDHKACHVELLPTPQAIKAWNKAEGAAIGLFHITC
ncbi:MAG: Mth938-like domain-containing protein [Anaerolineae bacterium]